MPDQCKCNLTATYVGRKSFIQTVGKRQTHKLKYKITNIGSEPGYDAKMRFLSPEIDLPFPKGASSYVLQWDQIKVNYVIVFTRFSFRLWNVCLVFLISGLNCQRM